ncbi:MAG: GNAT family N-acetyltransferase [Bacteroidales bacterium]|nr:GNAT family N-acetyltransferase [Bacteroidales bacterium]
MIIKITVSDNTEEIARLIRKSFVTVTQQFGITKDNAPTNPAYITRQRVADLLKKGEFYCKSVENKLVGTIAIEKSSKSNTTYYIEKVGIHPAYRHKGIGKELMDFAVERIIKLGGKKASIGIINEHTILKEWYAKQNFKEVGVKRFEHLPFTVCFMDRLLK